MLDFNNTFDLKTSKEQLRHQDIVKRQEYMEKKII